MSTVCKEKENCQNPYKDNMIVLDTNVLLHIICSIESGLSDRLTNNQRYESFKYHFKDFVARLRLCSNDGLIHTTKEVFDNEMNPTNPVSSIRSESSFIALCIDHNDNYEEIAHVLESNFTKFSSNIPSSEIHRLMALVGNIEGTFNRPNTLDWGLLALTMKLATNANALLLTDDTVLQRAIEQIFRTRYVTVFGRRVDTRCVGYASSLAYLEELYKCCKVQNKEFWCLFGTIYDFAENLECASGPTLTTKIHYSLLRKIMGEVLTIPK